MIALLGLPGAAARGARCSSPRPARVYVVVALSWLTATLLVPANDRPWAIGSTNGSAWNAAFVFNGTERLGGKSPEPQFTVYEPGHDYPTATQSQRDHIPIVPPFPDPAARADRTAVGPAPRVELLDRAAPRHARAAARGSRPAGRASAKPRGERRGAEAAERRSRSRPDAARAVCGCARAAGSAAVDADGPRLFSHMARLHPRYVEGFTPAVAAMLGIGARVGRRAAGRMRAGAVRRRLAVLVFYAERLLYGTPVVWWIVVLVGARRHRTGGAGATPALPHALRSAAGAAGALALTLVAVLAIAVRADMVAIDDQVSDAGYVGALPGEEQRPVSATCAHTRAAPATRWRRSRRRGSAR